MGENERLLHRLKQVECPDATYPAKEPALVLSRGAGSYVYDAEGREFIDLCAGFGALALGHNPEAHLPVFADRLVKGDVSPPISHGMGDVYASRAKVELLTLLTDMLPASLELTALALSGSQAVELAIKTALLATGKSGFIAVQGGYHGLDLGTLPLTSKEGFRRPFQGFLVEDLRVQRVPLGAEQGSLFAAAAELKAQGDGLAAVIVEPILGRAGVRPATLPWLRELREFCDRHDALLIFDEVFTGLGRSGRMTFAHEVPCDLLCLGKALGGGFPLSACVGKRRVMEAWPRSTGEALHTGTFFGHPFACEIAHATLTEICRANLCQRSQELGAEARQFLQHDLRGNPRVVDVRGEGLMLAIEFKHDGDGAVLMDQLRGQGIIALASGERGECLSITPALTIPADVLSSALELIARSI